MKDAPHLRRALDAYPRETLTRTPTPLHFLPHLSNDLGTQVYVKRDDLTDLALGGDKPRKLEYELAKARSERATILVTCGSTQSNHARLTTAAARRMGLDCAVLLSRDGPQELQGNLLAVRLMGAALHFIDTTDHWALEEHALRLCDELRSQGQTPYYIPISGTTPISCLGYVRAGLEIVAQLIDLDIEVDAIYTPFGTGGIFTAMLLAMRDCGIASPFVGISVNRNSAACRDNFHHWRTEICKLVHLDPQRSVDPVEIDDKFIGRGYGDATKEALDGMLQMARAEGILLDPVYSAKTFAGLRAHCQAGRWKQHQRILMLHSGGVPAIFAYHKQISEHLLQVQADLSVGSE